MRRWLFLLAGPMIWTVHFFGVYALASVADVVGRADAVWARGLVGAFSGVCAAACLIVLLAALRPGRRQGDELERFIRSAASIGAATSLVAVLWQGLPSLVGY